MSRPVLTLSPRYGDEATRRATAQVVEAINGTAIVRRVQTFPVHDRGYFHEVQSSEVDGTSTSIDDDDPYVAITDATVTVTPIPGTALVVLVHGEVGVTHTAATEAWAAIFKDGVVTGQPQRKTVAANEHASIALSCVDQITAATTYTLRAKKNAGGDATYTAERAHLTVLAVPQTDRYSGSSTTWEWPVHLECGDRESIREVHVVRSTNIGHATAYYRVRFGLRTSTRVDWIGTYDGSERDLTAGVPSALATGLDRVIRDDEVGVIEVLRVGEPILALEGTAIQVRYALAGG
jgi:hypothetical protein